MNIRSKLFYLALAIWTIFMAIVSTPVLATFSTRLISKLGIVWAYVSLKLLRLICNISYTVKGMKNIPKGKNFIIASKHSSAWETIFLLYYFRPASFVVKKELIRIPFYGWYLPFLGMIPISRKDGISSIRKVIKLSAKRLEQGFNFIIFPEGSRSEDSNVVKPGIYSIHKALKDTDVLPVSHNASKYFGGKGGTKMNPGKISVEILPPAKFDSDKKIYLSKIKHSINKCI